MQVITYARGHVEVDQALSRVLASTATVAVHALGFGLLLTQVVVPIFEKPAAVEPTVITIPLFAQPKVPIDAFIPRPLPTTIKTTRVPNSAPALDTQLFEPVVAESSELAEASDLPAQPSLGSMSPDREASADTSIAQMQRPVYPRIAVNQRWEGEVMLRVSVDAFGRALAVSVEQSSGHRLLDTSAQQAVMGWRFNPAIRGGRAVASSVLVPFEFKLNH